MAPTTSDLRRDDSRMLAVHGLVDVLVGRAPRRIQRPAPQWADIVSAAARPGTGGRRKRVDLGFEVEATRDLRERHGAPQEIAHRGSLLLIWDLDADGDGIVCARLSARDVQKGETAMAQIHNGLALAASHGLTPACAVVAMRTSGGAEYDRRIDFAFIRDRIAAHGLKWVIYREPDRIARELHAAHSFYKFLRDSGTDLYLCSLGRKVSWDSQGDRLIVGTLGVIGEFERGAIKARTHNAIKSRWLETGRGYPGYKPIGFRRDAHMFLEQDLEQWSYIRQASAMYAQLRSDGGTSVRDLAEFLTDKLGFPISRDRIRTMLKDPIYVTGMAHVTYGGVNYPLRPIQLIDPVSPETFDFNQALMRTIKGRQRNNPLGYFLLNRIDLLHDACQHHLDDCGNPVRLRCERTTYTHHRRCPLPECRGFALPHKELDAAVVRELLRLCEDPDLQSEYQARARNGSDPTPTGVLSESQRRSFVARANDLKRQREEIVRAWLNDGATSQNLNPRYLQESVEHIDVEITRLERQLELSNRLVARHGGNGGITHRGKLLERAREILTPEPPDDPELRQRRMIFVQQALSKVVARRTEGGFEIELQGPLIPADATPLHFDPLEHARSTLQGATDLEEYPWQSVPRWRGRGPVWRSKPICVRCAAAPARLDQPRLANGETSASGVPRRLASRADVRLAIVTISGEAPPGPMRARLDSGFPHRRDLLSLHRILRCLSVAATSLDDETRAVLGAEDALRLQRVSPTTVDDWQLIVGWAIDAGLSFGRGWSDRWSELNMRVGWMRSHRRLVDAQRTLGFDLGDLIEEALAARGLPMPVFDHRPGLGRDARFEACVEALREASLVAEPGRLTWPKLRIALSGREDLPTASQINNELHSLRISKDTALRIALGHREALVAGRVAARTGADWVIVIGAAIDAGYRGEGDWVRHWAALHRRDPQFVSVATVVRAVTRFGGFRRLYAQALVDRESRRSPEPASTGGAVKRSSLSLAPSPRGDDLSGAG